MSKIQVYNSLTKRIENFKTLEEGIVKIYLCGPTVYDHAHIGHGRSAVTFDVLRRVLEHFGYKVIMAINYTDIDDKMIDRASQEKIPMNELAERIIKSYEQDMRSLNVLEPAYRPRATEYVGKMIELTEELVKQGYAYITSDGVYFRVKRFNTYGKLSKLKLNNIRPQGDSGSTKENVSDFALMKKSKVNEPFWETAWGKVRPGWHIECSTMAMALLGHTFDIHGGGQDLIFPHHENEIAQSEALTGKPFVSYWVHNGFVTNREEKMSKSLGNFSTIKDVLTQGYTGLEIRYLYLTAHYRKPLEYTKDALQNAQFQVNKLKVTKRTLEQLIQSSKDQQDGDSRISQVCTEVYQNFELALQNDFNTPEALASMFPLLREINALRETQALTKASLQDVLYKFETMMTTLGLNLDEIIDSKLVYSLMDLIIRLRGDARKKKDWETSDRIRNELSELGIVIEDLKENTVWKKSEEREN